MPQPRRTTVFSQSSDILERLYADLLDLGLPDLILHPGRGVLGLIHLNPLALEAMHLLGPPLPEPYICVAAVGCLEGCLAGGFA